MIIISGNSRSGTTMMGRILGNHSRVFTFQELHFFDELSQQQQVFRKAGEQSLIRLYAKLISTQRDGYFRRSEGRKYVPEAQSTVRRNKCVTPADVYSSFVRDETAAAEKDIPCEQTPQNIFALEELFTIFPHARAVIMVRDPREVLLSQKNKWKRRQFTSDRFPLSESIRVRLNYHPVTMSRIWKAASVMARRYENDPRVLILKFEDILQLPAQTVQKVCSHCGITFESQMLDIPVVGSSNTADSPVTRKGIDASRTGQWREGLTEAEISICQEITANEMKHWGYTPVPVKAQAIAVFVSKATMPFRLVLSLPFNLKRLKNPASLLKRLFAS